MENPVEEIPHVIRLLCQSSPSTQRETIETYFTADAAFTHPFCRVPRFEGSRLFIRAIYRWYKIMSPRIDLEIKSVAYDASTLQLYVKIFQVFRIWAIPFYEAPAELVTVLQLTYDKPSGRYLITSQNDLYQVDQFVRFVSFGGHVLVQLWQLLATVFCVLGAVLLYPVTVYEEKVQGTRIGTLEDPQVSGPLDDVPVTVYEEKVQGRRIGTQEAPQANGSLDEVPVA